MSSHRCSPRGLVALLFLTFVVASPATLLAQTGIIQGRLLNAGGAGINRVYVRLTDAGGWEVAATTTDTIALVDGRYEFTGLVDGTYVVQVPWDPARDLAGQLYPGVPENDWDLATRIQITGNTVVLDDLTLRPAASISGSISGLSIGQSVSVTAQDPITGRHRGGTLSNPILLTYQLDGLPAGTYRVRVDPWGLPLAVQWYDGKTRQAEADRVAVAENIDVSGIDFTLSDGYSITGTVTLADDPADPGPLFQQMGVAVQDGLTYDWVQSSGIDSAGHFSVTNLPPGEYIVWINANQSGYVSEVYREGVENEWDSNHATRLVIATASIGGIDLTLERGWRVSGTVTLDTDGDGTGDRAPTCASVWVNSFGSYPGAGTTADASGEFAITGLRTGVYGVQTQSCSYDDPFVGQRWNRRTEFEQGDGVDVSADVTLSEPITLATGPDVSGRVFLDVNGNGAWDAGTDQPAPGFGVRLQQYNGGCCAHTNAGANGLYRIQVPAGHYRVEAQTGNSTLLPEFWENVFFADLATAVPAPATNIDLSLVDGSVYGTLRGRLIGADTGSGIGGVQVQVTRFQSDWWVTSAWTAADGTFVVTNLPPGDYRVYFETWNANLIGGADYIPTYWSVTGETGVTDSELMRVTYPATPVPVTGAGVDLDTFTLVVGGSISGVVSIDGGGALPIGLTAGAQRTDGWWVPWSNVDQATGAFRLRGLPPASFRVQLGAGMSGLVPVYYVSATESTFSSDAATLVDVMAGFDVPNVDLITFAGGSITGLVTRSDTGDPVEGAWVSVNRVNDPLGLGYGTGTSTNAMGAFEVPRLPTGDYQIGVNPPTGDLARNDNAAAVHVTAPLATTGVALVLDPGTSISGRVTLVPASSSALSQMWVQAIDPATGQGRGSTQPAADGTYTLEGLPPGNYKVEVQTGQSGYVYEVYRAGVDDEWDQSQATVITVAPDSPAPGIDFTLEEGARLSGAVQLDLDDDGAGDRAPICGSVSAGSLGSYAGNGSRTDVNGAYTIVGLRPGFYDVTIESCSPTDPFVSERWLDRSVFERGDAVDVSAGDVSGVDLVVAPGMAVSGQVFRDLDADGTKDANEPPLTNVRVRFYPPTGGCCAHAWTTSDGRYVMHLAPGQYVVEASAGGTLLTEYWQNVFFQDQAALVDVRTADAANVDFSLVDGTGYGTLRGRVVVAETTTGIGGVDVRVRLTTSGWDVASTTTTSDGSFAITPLPPATYVVYFDTQTTNRASGTDFVSSYWSKSGTPGVIDPADLLVVFPTVPDPSGGPGTSLGDFGLAVGGSVSGTVSSPDGYPLPSSLNVWADSFVSYGAPLPGAYVDLADGTYTIHGLPAPATYRIQGEAQGTAFGRVYYLSRDASTFDHNSATPVSVGVGADTPSIDLHLFEGGSISGTVTRAADGEPVAGIGVNVNLSNDPLGRGYWSGATTGTDGTYVVTGLPGGDYHVQTSAQGSGLANQVYPSYVSVAEGTDTPDIDFTLDVGAAISGTVTYLLPAGTPAAVVNMHVRAHDVVTGYQLGDTWTGADGGYTIEGLPVGRRYTIDVVPNEWPGPPFFDFSNLVREYYNNRVFSNDADPVPADPAGLTLAGVSGIDFELTLGGAISGRVTDAVTGEPLVNLHVNASDYLRGDWMAGDNTDQDGYYFMRGLPPGQYRVQTHPFPQNYVSEYYDDTTQQHLATPVVVPASSETVPVPAVDHVDFALMPGWSISGRVTGADGTTGVAGLRVYANGVDVSCWSNATTGENGDYVMTGLLDGQYQIFVEPGETDYARATRIEVVDGANLEDVDFALHLGARITGFVWFDADGDDAFDAGEERADVQVYVNDWTTGWGASGAVTDENGVYVVKGLETGTYRVQTEPDDRNYVRSYWHDAIFSQDATPVAVTTAGETVENIDFRLIQGYEIRGRVFYDMNDNGVEDPGEAPVSTGVTMEPLDLPQWAWGSSDTSGDYVIHGLPAGLYRIYAQAQDTPFASEYWAAPKGTFSRTQAAQVDVSTQTDPIDFSLGLGGGVTGVVRDAVTLEPLANMNVNVNAFDGDGFGFGQWTDESGRYLITGLPPGSYRLQVSDPDGVYLRQYYSEAVTWNDSDALAVAARSDVADPLASVVDFALVKGAAVEGHVYTAGTGAPIAGAQIWVNGFDYPWPGFGSTTTAADGSFHLGGLPPSFDLRVQAAGPSGADYIQVYYDGAGGTPDSNAATRVRLDVEETRPGIDFSLVPGGSIAGVVLDGNGDPIQGIWVYAGGTTPEAGGGGGESDASGAYVIHGLAPGTFVLNAGGGSTPYRFENYDNQTDYQAAERITVNAGQSVAGKNFVLPIEPRILSAPASVSVVRGGTTTVQILADRLADGLCGTAPCAKVDFGPGVIVQNQTLVDGTFTYDLLIAADAPLGTRQISVVNDFTVEDAAVVAQTAFTISPQAGAEPPASGQWLYVADSALGEVRVYSTVDYSYVGTLTVGGGPNSLGVDGPLLYAGAANGRSLTVVDVRLSAEVAKVEARGISGYAGVALTPQYVYTVNRDVGTNDKVNVLRRDTLEPETMITVGLNPYGVRVDPTAQWVYVANASSSSVSVIEVATNTVVATIPVPGSPRGLAFAPGDKAYVVTVAGTFVIDTATRTLTSDPAIPTRNGANGLIAIAPGGTLAYIGEGTSRIRVVDVTTNEIVRTFTAGLNPNGLALTDDGNTLFITYGASEDLYAVDTSAILTEGAVPITLVGVPLAAPSGGLAIGPYVPTGPPLEAPHVALASGSPASNGAPFEVTLSGDQFGTRPIVRLAGTWVQGEITAPGSTSLTVRFPADTPAGLHTVVVTDPDTGESGLSTSLLDVQPPSGFVRTQGLYLASYCSDQVSVLEPAGARVGITTEPFQASIGLTPDGKLAFVNHLYVGRRTIAGALADEYYDVTMLDLDPFSPTYRQRVATVPYVFGAFESVAVTPNADNPNGIFAFVTNYNFLDAVSLIDPTTRAEIDLDDNSTTQTLPDYHPWFGNMGTKLSGITRLELDQDPVDGNNQLWAPALTPDGTLLYVSNFGYVGDAEIEARPAGVFVIDAVNREPLAHLTGDGTEENALEAAYSLAVTPVKPDPESLDGVLIFVVGVHPSLGNALYVFRAGELSDAAAFVAMAPLPVAMPDRPRAIAIAHDGRTVYVTSRYAGEVIPVDVSTGAPVVQAAIPVGVGAHALAVAPDDGLLYVANAFRGTVSVVDIRDGSATRHQVLTTLDGGQCPTFAVAAPGLETPVISAIAPRSGPVAGGTAVTIIGVNFADDATVSFGGVAATSVEVLSPFTIEAVTPAGVDDGPVAVAVTSGGQVAEVADGFTYEPDINAPVFTTAPFILDQAIVDGTVTVRARWRTDEPSTSVVDYGSGGSLGSTVNVPALVTLHVVTLPGLFPGTTYELRATSVDAWTNSATSPAPPATLSFTTLAVADTTPPVIIGSPGVSVTTTTATIQWTTDEAATTAVHYDATLDGYPTLAVGLAGSRTDHSVTLSGLVPNRIYEFRVVSSDAGGYSTASAVATFRTAALLDTTPPVITAGPSVSYLSNDLVIVTWTTDELSTSFINYGTASTYEQTVIDTSMVATHIVFLTNLLPGTAYGFRAGSTDASGNTVLTDDPFAPVPLMALGARTLAAPMKAGAVTLDAGTTLNLTAATAGFSTLPEADTKAPEVIGLTFAAVAHDRALVTVSTDEAASLRVEYGLTTLLELSRLDPTFSGSHSLLLVGLTGNTTYNARVVLTDPKGNAAVVDHLTFTTPAAPDETAPVITGPSVSAITASSATVSWQTDEPATSEVRYGRSGLPLDFVVSALGLRSTHALTLAGLTAGTGYDVRVISRDASGNQATATTSFTTAWLPPVISSVTPPRGELGGTPTVTINGQRFEAGAQVSFGADTTLVGRTVNAAGTQIVATVSIAASATTGARSVTVTNLTSGMAAGATFTVVDTTVPVVTIAEPANGAELNSRTVYVEGTVSEPASVTVNGVTAVDTGGAPPTWAATIELAGTGSQVITATAVDPSGNRGTTFIGVTLMDAGPPTLTLTATPDALWPPNHQMVPVTISVVVEDDTDPAPVVRLIAATSSEPDDANGNGDGSTVNDIQEADLGTDDRQVQLRAERAGGGDGRVYTLTYEAVDHAGNRTVASVEVRVPHNE